MNIKVFDMIKHLIRLVAYKAENVSRFTIETPRFMQRKREIQPDNPSKQYAVHAMFW